jgi:chromosome segregation ATPase
MGDTKKREDIDALLGGLEEEASGESDPPADHPGPAEHSGPAESAGPPTGPPAIPKRMSPKECKGRTEFPDLFAQDSAALPAVRGGPEEKVEYFREKLRRAEAQIGRFREAWDVRTAEMGAVESLHAQERKRAEEATKAAQQMQAFMEQKKLEFEAYGKKVTQAFAEKDADEKSLREDLETARIETFEARAEAERLERELTAEVERERAEAEQEKTKVAQERAKTEQERTKAEQERARAGQERAKAEQEKAAANEARGALKLARAKCAELEERLQNQADVEAAVEIRDSTIQKLKESLKNAMARYEAMAAEIKQVRANANAAPQASVHVETVRKAVEVAVILLGQLEANETTARDPDASDTVERLHKALDIARREAAQI